MKIRSKLFLLLVAVSLVPLVVLGVVSTTIARGAVEAAAEEQLTKVRDELATATSRNAERAARVGREIAADPNAVLYLTYLGSKDVSFLEPILRKVIGYQVEQDRRILGIVARFPGAAPVAAMRREIAVPDAAAQGAAVSVAGEDAFCVTVPVEAGPNRGFVHVFVSRDWFTVEIDAAAVAADRPVAGFLVADGRLHGASATLNEGLLGEPYTVEPWLTFAGRVAAVGPVAGTPFHVGASMGEDEFLAPARSVRNASVLLVLVVAALVVVAALGFATTIVRPLSRMVAVARRVAGGDLDARVASRRSDELGELARDFDAMTGRLKTTIGDLDRRVRELTTLYEASTVINQSDDLKEVLALSGELLSSGFGVQRAVFMEARDGGVRFAPLHAQGGPADGIAIPADHPAVRRAFKERVVVEVADHRTDPGLKAAVPASILDAATCFLVVPILASKREVGLVLILAAKETPDEEDRRLFAVLSSLIAPLFVTAGPERSRVLYEGLLDDLAKLLERVDRMGTRCTAARIAFDGGGDEPSRAAARVLELVAASTGAVYRVSPDVVLAFFPGQASLEVESELTRRIAEKEPASGFTIRTVSYPDDAEEPEEFLARSLGAR